MATRVLDLIRDRGALTPGRYGVTRQIADEVGVTRERVQEILRELEADALVVVERGGRSSLIARVSVPAEGGAR